MRRNGKSEIESLSMKTRAVSGRDKKTPEPNPMKTAQSR